MDNLVFNNDFLYVGNVPKEFHYADFNEFYVDLFNTPVIEPNKEYTFYRVYLYDNYFAFSENTFNTSEYIIGGLVDIPTSDNIVYRRDFDSICIITFVFVLLGIWLLNLITSLIRKGGVLGGLF